MPTSPLEANTMVHSKTWSRTVARPNRWIITKISQTNGYHHHLLTIPKSPTLTTQGPPVNLEAISQHHSSTTDLKPLAKAAVTEKAALKSAFFIHNIISISLNDRPNHPDARYNQLQPASRLHKETEILQFFNGYRVRAAAKYRQPQHCIAPASSSFLPLLIFIYREMHAIPPRV